MDRSNKPGMRGLASLGLPAAVAIALGLLLGGYGIAIAAILSVLWLAWRLDNRTGTYLMLAILCLIALAVPALLLLLMAVTH